MVVSMQNNSVHVLLTGGAGYIGSHMLIRLLDAGYQVTVVDNLSTGVKKYIPASVPFFQIDIGDQKALYDVFQKKKIDVVLHFAASIKISESYRHPDKYYRNNFENTLVLLDVMRENKVNKIVFSSTAAIFGEPKSLPINEYHACNPISPYGKSKLMCEYALADYDLAYGIKSICLRYFNVCGYDSEVRAGFNGRGVNHIFPVLLQAASGEIPAVYIYGTDLATQDGTGVRDYIHVIDLCDAHVLSMEHLLKGGESRAYNLGNGSGYSVNQIVSAVEAITNKKINKINVDKREGDPAILIADSSMIQRELNWKPRYADLETIVQHCWQCKEESLKTSGVG